MSLSFEDSLKNNETKNVTTANESDAVMSVYNENIEATPVMAYSMRSASVLANLDGSDNWEPVTDKGYRFYDGEYADTNYSNVDELKNIILDSSQFNITQENNSQYIPFQMPRRYDGFDLAETNLSIYYINKNNEYHSDIPVDVYCNDEYIRFAWLVSEYATRVAGVLQFEIHARGTNREDEPYVWKSKPINKLNVLQSLEDIAMGEIGISEEEAKSLYNKILLESQKVASESQKVEDYAKDAKASAEEASDLLESLRSEIGSVESGSSLLTEEQANNLTRNTAFRETLTNNVNALAKFTLDENGGLLFNNQPIKADGVDVNATTDPRVTMAQTVALLLEQNKIVEISLESPNAASSSTSDFAKKIEDIWQHNYTLLYVPSEDGTLKYITPVFGEEVELAVNAGGIYEFVCNLEYETNYKPYFGELVLEFFKSKILSDCITEENINERVSERVQAIIQDDKFKRAITTQTAIYLFESGDCFTRADAPEDFDVGRIYSIKDGITILYAPSTNGTIVYTDPISYEEITLYVELGGVYEFYLDGETGTTVRNDYIGDEVFEFFKSKIIADCVTEESVDDKIQEAIQNDIDNIIPVYWQSVLDKGVSDINFAIEKAGINKSAFLFYTDAHWGYGSAMSPKLLKYLYENTAINKINFGGDFCNTYNVAAGSYMKKMREWRKAIRSLPNHHSVIGNHDADIEELTSEAQRYGFLLAPEETNDIIRGDYFHYYIDNQPEKTRYIYLDTGLLGCSPYTVSDKSAQFTIDALKSTPEGWHIVVISHIWFNYTDQSNPTVGDIPAYCQALLNMFDSYNARTCGTIKPNNSDISYDFSDAKGKVEFCMGGHIHVDHVVTSTNKIPVIMCQTDSYHTRGGHTFASGTTTEASVSGIIADYDLDKITVVRVGRGKSFEVVISTGEYSDIENDSEEEPVVPEIYDNVLFDDADLENDLAVGYEVNTRLSGGDGSTVALEGRCVSGYIPVEQGDILHFKNITMPNNKDNYNGLFIYYDESKTKHASVYASEVASSPNMAIVYGDDGNLKQIKNDYSSSLVKYIRFCAADINEASIITIDKSAE